MLGHLQLRKAQKYYYRMQVQTAHPPIFIFDNMKVKKKKATGVLADLLKHLDKESLEQTRREMESM